MNRKPTFEQIYELLKVYQGCNERVMAPIARFMLNFYDEKAVMRKLGYSETPEQVKRFRERMVICQNYFNIYFDGFKIHVMNQSEREIENSF